MLFHNIVCDAMRHRAYTIYHMIFESSNKLSSLLGHTHTHTHVIEVLLMAVKPSVPSQVLGAYAKITEA